MTSHGSNLSSDPGASLVDSALVAEAWTPVQPSTDPVLYGHVELSPTGPVEARSLATFTLVFTVGRFGIDDGGAIRIVFRAIGDGGRPQARDPSAENYVSATASTGNPLRISYSTGGVTARPRRKSLTVSVAGGYLREGDTVTVVFGDTSGGSPGMRMQSFVEAGFEFKVLADVCAVGHFIPIPDTPSVSIVPGPAVTWRAVLSSLRRPGEAFILGIKAEDKWGNPTHLAQGTFKIESTLPVKNLPERVDYPPGQHALTFEDLSVAVEGELRITLTDEATGEVVARSHPMRIRQGRYAGFWADLHGQSGESIGIGTSRAYFDFARDRAFLDATSHQANDFQVNNAFWKYLNDLTAQYHQDGRFVTFPGYEWSGNTAVGGDRNVFFRTEGRQIRRSSHALLAEREDIDSDANDANRLFEVLRDEDCVVYAHVGGRYADIGYAHDAKLETAMEIHSAWGTFEWLLTDGFELGHRSGVVCNSDGHKGRPGASFPGAGTFGAYGGLTCFYAEELTRDGIFECLRKRHHFGTTGTRMHLDVQCTFPTTGHLFDKDPNAFDDAASEAVNTVMMGDIVQTDDDTVTLRVDVSAQAPIERVEIRNGTGIVQTLRGYGEADLGDRIRVLWSGAECRGRGRETNWKGSASFGGSSVRQFAKINAYNHDRLLQQMGPVVLFDAITTGNYSGFDVWFDGSGTLEIATNHGNLSTPMDDIRIDDVVMDAGGLERKLRVFRLPENNACVSLTGEVDITINPDADNPLWVCVITEDGFQAWSSPIYVFR